MAQFPRRRRSRLAWLTAILVLLAALLYWGSQRSSRSMPVLAGFTVTSVPADEGRALPGAIPATRSSSPLVLTYEAPLDQEWVYLDCTLTGPDGTTAAEFFVQLEYYHGELDGEPWAKGSRKGSKLVELGAEGPYTLHIKGSAGRGDETMPSGATIPPLRLTMRGGMPRTRLLTWASVAMLLAASATGLRALSPGRPVSQPAPAAPQGRGSQRFLFLDGLRGVAVMAVLFCHFLVPEISEVAEALREILPAPLATLMLHGDLGVEIFFVLSGFVIAYTVVAQRITPGFTGRFIARRAIRLDPPYYLSLLLMLTIVAMNHRDGLAGAWRQFGGWETALANMFYLQDILHYPTPLDISWSLCLEIQFYLAFILICAIAQSATRLGARAGTDRAARIESGLRVAILLPLMGFSLFCWFPDAARFDFFGTWFRFALGVLACWTFSKRISPWWFYGAVASVAIPALLTWDLRGITVALTAGLIHVAGATGRLSTWLAGPIIQFLGRISYSLYLIHLGAGIFVVNLAWEHLPQSPALALLLVPAGIAGAILGAWGLYAMLERPSVAVSHRLKKRAPAEITER